MQHNCKESDLHLASAGIKSIYSKQVLLGFPQTKNCFRNEIQATSGAAMYLGGILTLLLFTLHDSHGSVQRVASVQCDDKDLIEDSIYNYTVPDLWGVQNISLSNYKGKVRDDVCAL